MAPGDRSHFSFHESPTPQPQIFSSRLFRARGVFSVCYTLSDVSVFVLCLIVRPYPSLQLQSNPVVCWRNMKRYLRAFNSYLWIVALSVVAGAGCETTNPKSSDSKKQATLFRIYVEGSEKTPDRSQRISIDPSARRRPEEPRETPLDVTIDRAPILDEANIVSASVVDTVGGYSIQVVYDAHGKIVLENVTGSRRGGRLIMFAQWTEARWLAAPMIARPIVDGVVTFTPDASRGECERIVLGINNIAKKLHK